MSRRSPTRCRATRRFPYGVGAPKGTPPDIVEKLNREINLALADPEIANFFNALDTIISTGSAADFGTLMDTEGAKWAAAIKASGATLFGLE